ncbi:MAG TPA: alpha-glucan family phosphorylase [Candidatus Sulfotelmatobacter sp.]|nr:alpha-glucan family phosphorylase [Candidatus Sulfotelmatobacter sp.]
MIRTPHIAYFCMEYGLDESFPIYSGGLGVLAGDFIKAARDLGKPVVAVGLRWERGYCAQYIDDDGHPYEEYPGYDHSFLKDTGVRLRVRVRGHEVACAVRVTDRYGHVPLYLIDPLRAEDRWITHRLYESGTDVRIAQEILLGIGGARALNWLGIPVATYHFNEGHAVFAGLEMIADRMESGWSFPAAWAETRKRIVFTTHTPVKAGNEEHTLKDLRRLGACLQLSGAEMREIGGDPFSMTIAGLRLARIANGVSALHGETARRMWDGVANIAPITHVTNGVHVATWQAEPIRRAGNDSAALWRAHVELKNALLDEVEQRTGERFDREALTIGFARRAASYKRGDLILRDTAQLEDLLSQHHVQLLFAGKSHPADEAGKAIISKLVAAQRSHPGKIAFLENYDMALARLLTRGCDVWLNNPVRPLEASGTSGMKAAMNGVLNLSILDGWWPEGCEHGVNGWAIGNEHAGDDTRDLEALYETLDRDVLPAWRDRERWQKMMRASIAMGVQKFSAERMVRDYFDRMYEPRPA